MAAEPPPFRLRADMSERQVPTQVRGLGMLARRRVT